jgi:hypothetical protein
MGQKTVYAFYFTETPFKSRFFALFWPRHCCQHHHRFISMFHSWNQAFGIMGFLGWSPNINLPWCWEQHKECNRTHPEKMVIVAFTWKWDLRGLKESTLNGHTLLLTNEVKYHGLILYKGLTYKAELVKPWVWNPGLCIGSPPWWSEPYWPTIPWFGGQGSVTMSAGQNSGSYRD